MTVLRNALASSLFASLALLATTPGTAAESHPWISGPTQVSAPTTRFTNLEDGARIETPYLLKFGLSRFGVSPIVKPVPRTGHHHLLVDRDLPLDFTQPLPFNAQYIHFGKGQIETVLDFPPGTYTLRLLLADDRHIPHFIYSKPVQVTVTRRDDQVDRKSLVKPGVQVLEPAAGSTLAAPFRITLHASGLNVGHVAVQDRELGHFRIVAERSGAPTETIVLDNGATETWLKPPPGDYRVRAELVRNAAPGDVIAASPAVALRVTP